MYSLEGFAHTRKEQNEKTKVTFLRDAKEKDLIVIWRKICLKVDNTWIHLQKPFNFYFLPLHQEESFKLKPPKSTPTAVAGERCTSGKKKGDIYSQESTVVVAV